MTTKQYKIKGMSCAACSASVQRVVSRLEGVSACDVNLITGKMTVNFDESAVSDADFKAIVERAGFGIAASEQTKRAIKEEKKESILPIIISGIASALLLYISMGQMIFGDIPLPSFINMNDEPYNFAITQLILCLPALITGRNFFIKGIPLAFKGHPNMDTLVAIGAGASLIYSIAMTYMISRDPHAIHNLYYESVAVVITLVMLGKLFERKSRNKTADAIKKLMELSGDTAVVLRGGNEYAIPTSDVSVGETLIIKAGAKIPLDGVVIKGSSSTDESMLTGESLPIEKKIGDKVTGGSINLGGLLYIEVTHIGEDTVLSKIIKFVEEAQGKKAPISKTADRASGIFVPTVIAVALLSAAIWLVLGKDMAFVLKIFTGVLVVACPCALGLATPTAIMVGTGLGALNGILIRNGEVLEATHKIKAAVFDKTGTLTVGKATVTDIISDNRTEILRLAIAAEKGSEHPLAKAISNYGKIEGVSEENVSDFQSISGNGVKCIIENEEILVGKEELLTQNGVSVKEFKQGSDALAAQGKSIVFVSRSNKCIGFLAIADELRASAKETIRKFKDMGIKTVLLSGDNRLCAEYIGSRLSVDETYSEVLPNEKAEIVAQIKEKYGSVLMVGDGINDAPALTEADVGCAIGSGSDIAIEAADIVLMRSEVADTSRAVNLSRLTIRNIKQNLFWAFCYNAVLIPVAAGVLYALGGPLLNPMLAGLAMSLSSVFVVGNALRLRFKKL